MAAESAMRRPSKSVRVGNPRIEMIDPPCVAPLAMFAFVVPRLPPPTKSGLRFWSTCKTSPAPPAIEMSPAFRVSRGDAVTSSAVGIFEPVTTMRSAVASPPAGAGVGVCAYRLAPTRKENPTPATMAARTNLTDFITLFIISFSIGLVRFEEGLKKISGRDKCFFHFFKKYFERRADGACRIFPPSAQKAVRKNLA